MCRGKCDGGAVRDARQAEPKMSRLKVFYIIISIGALFSKVRIRNPGMIPMTSWAMLMTAMLMMTAAAVWDMFWCSARASHPCQDHDLFGPTALCSPLLLDGEVAARHNECIRWPGAQVARYSHPSLAPTVHFGAGQLWAYLGIFGKDIVAHTLSEPFHPDTCRDWF